MQPPIANHRNRVMHRCGPTHLKRSSSIPSRLPYSHTAECGSTAGPALYSSAMPSIWLYWQCPHERTNTVTGGPAPQPGSGTTAANCRLPPRRAVSLYHAKSLSGSRLIRSVTRPCSCVLVPVFCMSDLVMVITPTTLPALIRRSTVARRFSYLVAV